VASAEEVEAARVRGVVLDAELDRESGAVILPLDRLFLTTNEQYLITDAVTALVSKCAAAQGVDFDPGPVVSKPIYESEEFYGNWTVAQAERFGFVRPSSEADLVANGVIEPPPGFQSYESPNINLTDAESAVVEQCYKSPEAKSLRDSVGGVGPWFAMAEGLIDTPSPLVVDDPRVKEAWSDLSACFARAGLEPNSDPYWMGSPVGARSDVIDEEQISLSLKTVACKDEVAFTERVADVTAEKQAAIIVKYLDEMVAYRQSADEALATARQIVAER